MNQYRGLIVLVLCVAGCGVLLMNGCASEPQYGTEQTLRWPGRKRQVWAVAPAVNLSGQTQVDPLIQGDLLFEQVQQVGGITAIPVNRVVEVYTTLRIDKVQSQEQAQLVCDLLGCDALLVPSVTAYDPYNPPKLGVSLQLFEQSGTYARPASVDVRELARQASPGPNDSLPPPPPRGSFFQVVGMYDAANGSVRDALTEYAHGRNDPKGPLGTKEYFVSMDRYSGFVYHDLIDQLMVEVISRR